MNQEQLVAAIVAEVKRVLSLRGISVESSGGAVKTPARPNEPAPSYSPPKSAVPVYSKTPVAVAPKAGGVAPDLTGLAVVTRKSLEGVAGGQARIASRAVVTPMAHDYAREKGISFVRDDSGMKGANPGNASAVTPVVAVAVEPSYNGGNRDIAGTLGRYGVSANMIEAGNYEAAVIRCAEEVASGAAAFGFCIERTGLAGPVYANRNPRIRAVSCRNINDVRAARRDLDANIIVLDSMSLVSQVVGEMTGKASV